MRCEVCSAEFEQLTGLRGRPRRYCSQRCALKKSHHDYYLSHKDERKENAKKWAAEHPERKKEIVKKAFSKFITEKPKRFKRLLWRNFERKKASKLAGTFDTAEERSDLAKSPIAERIEQ